MADLEFYRHCIRRLLSERAQLTLDDCIQAETVFDRARDRYLLVRIGWRGETRIYQVVWHLEILEKQVWIQQDGAEQGIANDLIEMGIPQEQIVLGFDPIAAQPYADIAIGRGRA